MIRISTIFLCILLAAAAFGRYRAEVSVRELREDIRQIETSQTEEVRAIQMLRAEIAYLENPDRLARIAEAKTDLRPSNAGQIVSAHELASLFSEDAPERETDKKTAPPDSDVILHALAVAQLASAD